MFKNKFFKYSMFSIVADKAKKLFGWTPKVALNKGIDRTIKLWQNQS